MKQHSLGRHVHSDTLLWFRVNWFLILLPNATCYGKAINTKFTVFGLTRPLLEPTIYHTWVEHTNHSAKDDFLLVVLTWFVIATVITSFRFLPYTQFYSRRVWRYQRGNQNLYIDFSIGISIIFRVFSTNIPTCWPSPFVDLSRIWLSCLGLLVFYLTKILIYLAFKYFDLERTWWRLFQKRVVRTKLHLCILLHMTINRKQHQIRE